MKRLTPVEVVLHSSDDWQAELITLHAVYARALDSISTESPYDYQLGDIDSLSSIIRTWANLIKEYDKLWSKASGSCTSSMSIGNGRLDMSESTEIVATYISGRNAYRALEDRLQELEELQRRWRYEQGMDGILLNIVPKSAGSICTSCQLEPFPSTSSWLTSGSRLSYVKGIGCGGSTLALNSPHLSISTFEDLYCTPSRPLYNEQQSHEVVLKSLKSGSGSKKELPMVINTKTISARYDTGAEGNFMSKALAVNLGLKIDVVPPGEGVFKLPNGKKVTSIGRAQTPCSFARDVNVTKDCSFWIWDKLAGSNMIMGQSFLDMTQTLSKYLYRLAPKIARSSRHMLHSIESTTNNLVQRLYCKLDGTEVLVNSDTGSDLDVMSLKYARRAGYTIDKSIRREILLGDGTLMHTIGRVTDVLVSVGESVYYRSFDVLPGIELDVILGEQTIEILEAYTNHEDCFTMVYSGSRHHEMHTIVDRGLIGRLLDWSSWKRRRRRENTGINGTLTSSTEPDTTLLEACRRDKADRFIESLSDSSSTVKQKATQAEQTKRDLWDRKNRPLQT